MSYLSKVFEELRAQIYPNEISVSATKTNYNRDKFGKKARYASIKGRTRNEIVKEAIEAIKKYGLIRTGVEAMVKNVYAGG